MGEKDHMQVKRFVLVTNKLSLDRHPGPAGFSCLKRLLTKCGEKVIPHFYDKGRGIR